MSKFELKILFTFLVCVSIVLIFSCNKETKQPLQEETATTKPSAAKSCYTVCDVNKNPDLQLVTNAEEEHELRPDGSVIDSFTYFFLKYHLRTKPIVLTQNYVTPGFYTTRYGWDSGIVVNKVQFQCVLENIAPFGCENDWVFNESQGYPVGQNIFFDGLFQFDTYEKGNGNNWKFLYSDYKKEFFPSVDKVIEFQFYNYCWYERAIQAQAGDEYNNPFRFPNHDGVYKLVLKFNPSIKGCRAVKETNYTNNEKTIQLQISNGQVIIVK